MEGARLVEGSVAGLLDATSAGMSAGAWLVEGDWVWLVRLGRWRRRLWCNGGAEGCGWDSGGGFGMVTGSAMGGRGWNWGKNGGGRVARGGGVVSGVSSGGAGDGGYRWNRDGDVCGLGGGSDGSG